MREKGMDPTFLVLTGSGVFVFRRLLLGRFWKHLLARFPRFPLVLLNIAAKW